MDFVHFSIVISIVYDRGVELLLTSEELATEEAQLLWTGKEKELMLASC